MCIKHLIKKLLTNISKGKLQSSYQRCSKRKCKTLNKIYRNEITRRQNQAKNYNSMDKVASKGIAKL